MSNSTRLFLAGAGVTVLTLGALVAIVMHDLSDGSAMLADVEQQTQARYATRVDLPPLRSPAEDCDGLQRQLDIFKKVAPPDISHQILSSGFRPGSPIPPTIYAFLADHENGFDSVLDATRCTFTKLDRREIGHEFRPGFAVVKTMLWRAEMESTPRLEPAACVQWCNEVLRANLDNSPGEGTISLWHERVIPMVEARLSECAATVDNDSAKAAAENLARILKAWPPFSTQLQSENLETAATLTYYYEADEDTTWPFHGPRAHLQFRRVLANDKALLARPDDWKVVDFGSFQARLSSLRAEFAARDIRAVPFGDSVVVSPGWDIGVGTSNTIAESLEQDLSDYIKVQATVRMGYAMLISPTGNISDHADDSLAQDPFAEHAVFHWDASRKSYYSVGPNGLDDGGSGDDIVVGKGS